MSGQDDKAVCDFNQFRRPRYFHGMLLEERDFKAEQGYHAAKRRLLNRSLHGTGVVCGLELSAKADSKEIRISGGLALDCGGNEIWVDQDLRLDLGKLLRAESVSEASCPPADPPASKTSRYVVIEYRETDVDPVSVYVPGAGCDQHTCEHSRTREGYCVRLVRSCALADPDEDGLLKRLCRCFDASGDAASEAPGCLDCSKLPEAHQRCQCRALEEFCTRSVPCPDCTRCAEDHQVVLGRIDLDEKLERVRQVCMNDCRRYVLTGKMVQHLVVSVLTGAGDHVGIKDTDITLPPAMTLAHNPIWALCWFVRHLVIQDQALETKKCGPGREGSSRDRPATIADLEQLQASLEQLKANLEQHLKDVEGKPGKK